MVSSATVACQAVPGKGWAPSARTVRGDSEVDTGSSSGMKRVVDLCTRMENTHAQNGIFSFTRTPSMTPMHDNHMILVSVTHVLRIVIHGK